MQTRPKLTYYAVPDPDTCDMTYWMRTKRGQLKAWPATAKVDDYGPRLWFKPGHDREHVVPEGLTERERGNWIRAWYDTVRNPWVAKILAAIEREPDAARARFAAFTSHCCICGRTLTDEDSRVRGIGPDCIGRVPAAFAEACAREIARLHGEAGGEANDRVHVGIADAAAMVPAAVAIRADAADRATVSSPVDVQLPLVAGRWAEG